MHPLRAALAERTDERPPDELGPLGERLDGQYLTLSIRHEVVTPLLERANTRWTRMRGLLGRGGLSSSEGLWITPCKSIHMFFMRFSIDAIFIDRDGQVVRVYEDLRPWRLARGGKYAYSVLELPPGKAAFYNIRVGDRLTIRR